MEDKNSLITPTPTDCGAHLITLIINQDHVSYAWLKFLITVEASLAVGLGFIIKLGGVQKQWFYPWVVILFPTLGILSAIFLSMIVVRERKWQAWYVQQFNKLPGQLPQIFPKDKSIDGPVRKQKLGSISIVVIAFAILVAMAWIVVIKALVGTKG
ncbi:MAG: hypothetical protein WCC06_11280 [Candidatus Aminicenantales bacterium]